MRLSVRVSNPYLHAAARIALPSFLRRMAGLRLILISAKSWPVKSNRTMHAAIPLTYAINKTFFESLTALSYHARWFSHAMTSGVREIPSKNRKAFLFMPGDRIEILDRMLRADKGKLAAPVVDFLEYRACPRNVVVACDDRELLDSKRVRQRRGEHGLPDGVMRDYAIDRKFRTVIPAEPALHTLVVIVMAGKDDARLRIEVRFRGLEARDSFCIRVAVLVVVAAQDDECVIYVISSARTPSLSLISFLARLPSIHSKSFGSSPGRALPLRSTATFFGLNISPFLMSRMACTRRRANVNISFSSGSTPLTGFPSAASALRILATISSSSCGSIANLWSGPARLFLIVKCFSMILPPRAAIATGFTIASRE